MREIKFRGKTYENEWVYGSFIDAGSKKFIWNRYPIEVDPKTVGLFTDFYDAKKKPIYEGDLVISAIFKEGPVYLVAYSKYEGWIRKLYKIKNYEPAFTIADPSENYMVIGNIHDNPELYFNRLYKSKSHQR